jgi:N6-L-threonylcarbamoyladenine synthase
MKILAFESSCDETACAIVENGRVVFSNVIASQILTHQKTQGVVPEVAARKHVPKLLAVYTEALKQAGLTMNDIDAIACSVKPGLVNCLITGASMASTLAMIHKKPLIPVNHKLGHVLSCMLIMKMILSIQLWFCLFLEGITNYISCRVLQKLNCLAQP